MSLAVWQRQDCDPNTVLVQYVPWLAAMAAQLVTVAAGCYLEL